MELDPDGNEVKQKTTKRRFFGLQVPLIKIFYLAAYADMVANGEIDPDGQVNVAEWEMFHLPSINGVAHTKPCKWIKGHRLRLYQKKSVAHLEQSC